MNNEDLELRRKRTNRVAITTEQVIDVVPVVENDVTETTLDNVNPLSMSDVASDASDVIESLQTEEDNALTVVKHKKQKAVKKEEE